MIVIQNLRLGKAPGGGAGPLSCLNLHASPHLHPFGVLKKAHSPFPPGIGPFCPVVGSGRHGS